MSREALLLRDAIEHVLASTDDFAELFYARLFERHPHLRPMFHRSSADAQRKMFTQKLVALIDSYDDSESLGVQLAEVAVSHAGYGVTPVMYDWVGAVLLEVLAEVLGPRWDADTARVFQSTWAAVSATVLAATPTEAK